MPEDTPQTVSIPVYDVGPTLETISERAVEYYQIARSWLEIGLSWLIVISIPLSVFFFIGIIYTVQQLKEVRRKEAEKHDRLKIEPGFEDVPGAVSGASHDLSVRWAKVNEHMNSANQNDWKQAILEADTMLDDILDGLGYRGESIGEKLKRVQPGEFKNVQDAWDAHKVRNSIAHEPGFQLTHHEANQAIQQYRRIFEEFYYI